MYRVNRTQTPQNHPPPSRLLQLPLACGSGGIPHRSGFVLRPALPVLSSLHSFLLALIPTVLFFSPSSLFFPLSLLPHSFPHFLPGVAPVLEPFFPSPPPSICASAFLQLRRFQPLILCIVVGSLRSPASPGTCPSALPAPFARPVSRTLTNGRSLLCVGCCFFFLSFPSRARGCEPAWGGVCEWQAPARRGEAAHRGAGPPGCAALRHLPAAAGQPRLCQQNPGQVRASELPLVAALSPSLFG